MNGIVKKTIFILAIGALTVAGASPAFAELTSTPAPTPTPTSTAPAAGLTVSTPIGALPAQPGAEIATWLRIGNTADTPITVTILPATVKLGNNGVSGFVNEPDPLFGNAVTFSTSNTIVPANGYIQVDLTVKIPKSITPDVYILGFLVTPKATGNSVRIVNQIGALISLDVPGVRDRRLAASFTNPPWIIFSDQPSLSFRAKSVGKSALEFTSEDSISGPTPVSPVDSRHDPLLLPAGLYRDVTVSWSVPWGFGVNTITTRLLYPKSQASNAEIVLTRTVVVITPLVLAIVGGILLIIALVTTFLIRRRIKARRAARRLKVSTDSLDETPFPHESDLISSGEFPTRRMNREQQSQSPRDRE